MAAQNCQKPSVSGDHDGQQDQNAGIWRDGSQNDVPRDGRDGQSTGGLLNSCSQERWISRKPR